MEIATTIFWKKTKLLVYTSWNQLHEVLSNEGKTSCLNKQKEPLMGFKLKTDGLEVRGSTHLFKSSA